MAGRYIVTERPIVLGKLLPGVPTLMSVYDMTGLPIALAPGDDACAEITPGIFVWDTNLLPPGTILLTGLTKLLFVMDNGAFTVEDSKEWGGWMDRVVGMVQENIHIDNTAFDAVYGGMTSARIRLYIDGSVLGGALGVVTTYQLTAVPSGINQYSSFEIEKV